MTDLAEGEPDTEIELGCSRGDLLCRLASVCPDRRFIGIDIIKDKCDAASAKAMFLGLSNIRIVHAEAHAFIRTHVASNSVAALHIYFPTPRPTAFLHARGAAINVDHCLITPNFLIQARRILRPGGTLRIVTDHQRYFEEINSYIEYTSFVSVPWTLLPISVPPGFYVNTSCERRYRNQHKFILRSQFIK